MFAVIIIGHTLSSRAELHQATLPLSYWPMDQTDVQASSEEDWPTQDQANPPGGYILIC